MFWTGFFVGLFIGSNIGLVVLGLLVAAKKRQSSRFSFIDPCSFKDLPCGTVEVNDGNAV
jgi:hypothetical protein